MVERKSDFKQDVVVGNVLTSGVVYDGMYVGLGEGAISLSMMTCSESKFVMWVFQGKGLRMFSAWTLKRGNVWGK